MKIQPKNRYFQRFFEIFELKKIRELANRELDNSRISAPWLYLPNPNTHPLIEDFPLYFLL